MAGAGRGPELGIAAMRVGLIAVEAMRDEGNPEIGVEATTTTVGDGTRWSAT